MSAPEQILSICGLTISLRVGNARLRQSIARRYRGYVRSKGKPILRLACTCTRSLRSSGQTPKLVRSGADSWRMYRRDFVCEWAGSSGTARLYPSVYALDGMLRILLATLAAAHRRVFLHAAGAACGNKAFVFLGQSGRGKTTVSRQLGTWRILNDEIVCLEIDNKGRVLVHGTPFWGEMGTGPVSPRPYSLAGLYVLRKSRTQTRQAPVGVQQTLVSLLKCVCCFGHDASTAENNLMLTLEIASIIPGHRLEFQKGVDLRQTLMPC